MKRILSVLLLMAVTVSAAAGCGRKPAERILYNVDLNKYIELGEYKGIPVDKSSETFQEYYNDIISGDISENGLYVRKTEGKVAEGDNVNIDYVGKKDGVAFEGGTAEGYDLVIGSGSFIDGFEDGLIGAGIGSTVDLNLTFPENYQEASLAGQPVVFTVKVNYVTTEEERKPEEYYSELGFENYEAYKADAEERAVKNYLVDTVLANSDVKKYPKDDNELIYEHYRAQTETAVKNQYGIEFSDYLSAVNQTEEDFKNNALENQVEPMMDNQMMLYAVCDNEGLTVTEEDTAAQLNEMLNVYKAQGITKEQVLEAYGEYYFEYLAFAEKAVDFLYDNAEIS